jgi:DtxR family Mn-dependent transcriptional regulator
MTITASMENYLEAIFLLIQENTVARAKDIADRMNVKRASVSKALHGLRNAGLVNHEPYGFVALTREGSRIAKRVHRRHEALKGFMVTVLSIDEAEADEAACYMEHGLSKHVVDRFADFARFVEACPHEGATWVEGLGYRCDEQPGELTVSCERCAAPMTAAEPARIASQSDVGGRPNDETTSDTRGPQPR